MLFTWIIFIIQALVSSVFLQEIEVGALSILFVIITSLFLVFDLAKLDFPKQIFILLIASYMFRLFLMFFDLYGRELFILPNSGLDSEMFNAAAIKGLLTGDYGRGHIYSFFIGVIYRMFGVNRLMAQFFNVVLSVQAIIIVYKTMDMFKLRDKTKNFVTAIMAFLPNYAIMSSILLRESILVFLAALSFYCFSKWLLQGKVLAVVPAFGFGLLMAVFHSGSIFLVGAYTVFLVLYNSHKQSFNISMKSILLIVFFLIAFNFIYETYFDLFFAKFMNKDSLKDVMDVTVMGQSAYAVGLTTGNPVMDFIVNTPIRMLYFLLAPFPWDWRGQADIIAFLFSGLFYGGTLLYAVKQIVAGRTEQKRYIVMLLVIIGFGLLFFAWGVSNAGTALRHRDKFIGLFIVLLALLVEKEPDQRGEMG